LFFIPTQIGISFTKVKLLFLNIKLVKYILNISNVANYITS